MAQQTIDTTTDHGTYKGDPASTAFNKINANDTELFSRVAATETVANKAKSDIAASGINVQSSPTLNMDQQENTKIGIYTPSSSATPPTSAANFGTVIYASYGAGQFTQLAVGLTVPVAGFRAYNNAWSSWNLFWHTGNTTVDANLFIKKAS